METVEYRDVIDRTGWPSGEWDSEPDKIQYADEKTGLPCLIKRNRMGGLCGYVGVAEGHPVFGKCNAAMDDLVVVHGGVTYTDACQGEDDPAHGICHIPGPGEPDHVWWVGYDCGHGGIDLLPALIELHEEIFAEIMAPREFRARETYKTVEYVKSENASLALQLAALA